MVCYLEDEVTRLHAQNFLTEIQLHAQLFKKTLLTSLMSLPTGKRKK